MTQGPMPSLAGLLQDGDLATHNDAQQLRQYLAAQQPLPAQFGTGSRAPRDIKNFLPLYVAHAVRMMVELRAQFPDVHARYEHISQQLFGGRFSVRERNDIAWPVYQLLEWMMAMKHLL